MPFGAREGDANGQVSSMSIGLSSFHFANSVRNLHGVDGIDQRRAVAGTATMTVEVIRGDITQISVDAVVNAANNGMRGGGGVDGAIHRVGGRAILDDCVRRFPNGLATGDAGWTVAGNLPARWVIHTVGPNYRAGQRDRSLLESCYRASLAVADELGARSVAFPLISSGAYGWPRADAIEVAISTIVDAGSDVGRVLLVAFDDALADEMRTRLARRGQ